jgi:DNA processing protein
MNQAPLIPLTDREQLDWLRLSRTENIGPITFHRLLQRYGSATKALETLPHLAAQGGRKKPLIPPPLAAIEQEYERLKKRGGDIICAIDPRYPLALAAIEDAPPVISVIGNIDLLARLSIGVVGARNASMNAKKFSGTLSHDLGQSGFVVASGLARGIDTAAHQGALKTGTIAVVAGGIDVVYPPENKNLYDAIAEQGLIVAESPLSQEPFAQSFPRRNRIISGLSQGIVVVEASLRSGSLITARMAAEQGRDVFAVPGHPLDPRADGTNSLIRDGAVLVRSAEDILQDIGRYTGRGLSDVAAAPFIMDNTELDLDIPANDMPDLSGEILEHLSATPVDVDELIRLCGARAGHIGGTLLSLELAGAVQRLPGNRVVRLFS